MQFVPRTSSFRGYTRSFRAVLDYVDPHMLYRDARDEIYNILNSFLSLRIRIIICLAVIFTKFDDNRGEVVQEFYFCSHAERVLSRFQILQAIDRCFNRILRAIECFIHNVSGWVIKRISFLRLKHWKLSCTQRGVWKYNFIATNKK